MAIRRVLLTVLLVAAAFASLCAKPQSLLAQPDLFSPIRAPKSLPGTTVKDGWIYVVGKGLNEDEAIKDGLRQAVVHAVGFLLDSEERIKNDELIHEILIYSKGFVSEYQEQGKAYIQNGIVCQPIRAKVESVNLANTLKKRRVNVQEFDGRKLFGQIITKRQEKQDARKVIERLFEAYPVGVLKVDVAYESQPVKVSEEEVTLGYDLTLSVDEQKYKEFLVATLPILNKIADRNGKITLTNKTAPKHIRLDFYKYFLEESCLPSSHAFYRTPRLMHPSPARKPEPWWTATFDPETHMVVLVDTLRGQGKYETELAWYHVPRTTIAAKRLEVAVSFVGEDKNVIEQRCWSLGPNVPAFNCEQHLYRHAKTGQISLVPQIVISPYFHTGNCIGSALLVDRDITIPLNKLAGVRKVVGSVSDKEGSPGKSENVVAAKRVPMLPVKFRPKKEAFERENHEIDQLKKLLDRYELPYRLTRSSTFKGYTKNDKCIFHVAFAWHDRLIPTLQEVETLEADLAGICTVRRCFDFDP